MNIFVLSPSDQTIRDQALVNQLSCIGSVNGATNPVTVIDDYGRLQVFVGDGDVASHVRFELDDFLARWRPNEVMPNRVASLLSEVDSDWIVLDLGYHEQAVCHDFIRALAHYHYLHPQLRRRNLVFQTPASFLYVTARLINETFNVLPGRACAKTQRRQLRKLFITAHAKRIPGLAAVKRRLAGLYRSLLRRRAGVT